MTKLYHCDACKKRRETKLVESDLLEKGEANLCRMCRRQFNAYKMIKERPPHEATFDVTREMIEDGTMYGEAKPEHMPTWPHGVHPGCEIIK